MSLFFNYYIIVTYIFLCFLFQPKDGGDYKLSYDTLLFSHFSLSFILCTVILSYCVYVCIDVLYI